MKARRRPAKKKKAIDRAMIQIQATVSGYGGKPATLFSAYDETLGALAAAVASDYRPARRAGCVVLTNVPDIDRDTLYGKDDLRAAIDAFVFLKDSLAVDGKTPRLIFLERAARANPAAVIEVDGMDASGTRYRVSETVTSTHIAALLTCLYVSRAADIAAAVSMSDALARFMRGEAVTI
jgi:hypothetical protein